jgi:hypothetical protein
MIDLLVGRLTRSRSAMSIGLPRRQTIRVRPVEPTLSRISSSVATLSFSARRTMAERDWFLLAMTSSDTMEKT